MKGLLTGGSCPVSGSLHFGFEYGSLDFNRVHQTLCRPDKDLGFFSDESGFELSASSGHGVIDRSYG
jgi:hypothetical protein